MDVPVVETYERICSGTSACSVISNDMWPRDWAVIEKERRQVGGGYLSGGQDLHNGSPRGARESSECSELVRALRRTKMPGSL